MLCTSSLLAQSDYIVTTIDTPADSDSTATRATASSPEEAFLAEHFPYLSLCDWRPGMRFLVVPGQDDVYFRLFTDSITGHEVGPGELKHKTMEYRGYDITSRGWIRLNLYCVDSQRPYYYEIRNFAFDDYCRRVQGGGVPSLVYLGDVDRARELLIGHELWLKTTIAYRDNPSSSEGFTEVELPQDSRVTVERIGAGTREYPVKIVFRGEDGQLYFNTVAMSCTNSAMGNDDFIMTRAHHHFAKAFALGSQTDTKSAKMSDELVGKYVTLRRACQMTQGGTNVNMKAATKFVVQNVEARRGTSYYTLTLTSSGKIYHKDVTFENSNVAGNIDGNDERYFNELFTIGEKYVPSNSQIHRTADVTKSSGRSNSSTSTPTSESVGGFMNMIGGVISQGMTQDEVRMSKGDPEQTHRLKSGGTQWDYYDGTKVQFNSKGRVSRIIRN